MTARPDSRSYWRDKALLYQKMIGYSRADYDQVEAELKALLTPERDAEPNPSLLTLSHHDLALLADEWRVKLLNQ